MLFIFAVGFVFCSLQVSDMKCIKSNVVVKNGQKYKKNT